jgi:colanic acid/amylovoran biosynthesis glycosyltransferase
VESVGLLVVSPMKCVLRGDNRALLTRKFVDGLALYKELWKGPLTLLCEPADHASDNLDNVEVDLARAPFRMVTLDLRGDSLRESLVPRSLLLAPIQFTQCSRLARAAGIPSVYVSENSLLTRLQILREDRLSFMRKVWRSWRELKAESAQRKALTLSEGVQCNGIPTHEAYKSLTPMPLLFFDTRIEQSQLAGLEQVRERCARFARDRKLRLVFSGRLNRIKGVQDLPLVAAELKRRGVAFELSICGDGELMPELRASVSGLGLADCVKFRGVLDFKSELVPFVTGETDLFVCCHLQGDPSCTYLETMACGVPIVGYANEAFRGLAGTAGTGWVTPLSRPIELADRIASLSADPDGLRKASERSLEFAAENTFEKTFRRRIDHLDRVAGSYRERVRAR